MNFIKVLISFGGGGAEGITEPPDKSFLELLQDVPPYVYILVTLLIGLLVALCIYVLKYFNNKE